MAYDLNGQGYRKRYKRRKLNEAEDFQVPDASSPPQITEEPTVQHGHRVDKISIENKARAHVGNVINNYYSGGQPQSDSYEALLQSLTFARMDARLRDVAKALPATCGWLPRHKVFVEWTDVNKLCEHQGFLWIKGKPGSGKSTILKETLLWAEQKWSEQILLSYFFNARSSQSLEKSPLGLYRSLLHQLLCLMPSGRALFMKAFQSKLRREGIDDWTETEIQNFFIELIETLQMPPITIFIDALDEGIEDDIRQMIQFLECLTEHAAMQACLLRVCLTSRHYPHISVSKSLSLILEDQIEHIRDIELYIRSQLSSLDISENSHLQRRIRDQSNGVFLWVILVIAMVNKSYDQGKSESTILRKLQEIPSGLSDVFSQMFFRDTEDMDECTDLLSWVLFSQRPLSAIELYAAVQHTSHQTDFAESFDITPGKAARYLVYYSRGLVETKGKRHNIVQFIHETVRQYFSFWRLSEQPNSRLAASNTIPLHFQADMCHMKLSESCLNYLLLLCKALPMANDEHRNWPLASYAAEYWWQHLHLSQSPCSLAALNMALELLNGDPTNLLLWIQLYNVDRPRPHELNIVDDQASPLYYAASIGIQEVVSSILATGVNINDIGGWHGTALGAASFYGHEKIVQTLIRSGADVNAKDVSGGIPHEAAIHKAAKAGHAKITQMLIDAGASIDAKGFHVTALQIASENGHEQVVQLLINAGSGVDTADILGTPLQLASKNGHEAVVQTLIDAGADINAGGILGNALQRASEQGHDKVVYLLMQCGAKSYALYQPSFTNV